MVKGNSADQGKRGSVQEISPAARSSIIGRPPRLSGPGAPGRPVWIHGPGSNRCGGGFPATEKQRFSIP